MATSTPPGHTHQLNGSEQRSSFLKRLIDFPEAPASVFMGLSHESRSVRLALAFAGDDEVATRVESVNGRFESGPTTAHKGHEMRKALDVRRGRWPTCSAFAESGK